MTISICAWLAVWKRFGVYFAPRFPRGVGIAGIMSVNVELPRLDEGTIKGALFRCKEG